MFEELERYGQESLANKKYVNPTLPRISFFHVALPAPREPLRERELHPGVATALDERAAPAPSPVTRPSRHPPSSKITKFIPKKNFPGAPTRWAPKNSNNFLIAKVGKINIFKTIWSQNPYKVDIDAVKTERKTC